MELDAYAGEEHFADHLKPVFDALADPGELLIARSILDNIPNRWYGTAEDPVDPSRPVLVASYGDQKRMRKRGRTRIARMEHGAGQSYGTGHGSYAGGKDCEDVSLFLMPNQYSADKWKAAYPGAQVEIVGCPKLDTLPAKQDGPLTIAIGFHWDCHLVPETVSAFGTFRFALEALRDKYNLIGHGHPRGMIGPPGLVRRYRRAEILLEPSFTEVCRKADLYICDNSSSMYEFAATGRPVVVMNGSQYRRGIDHGLRFWDAIPGIEVNHHRELLDAVAEALTDPPALQRKREDALDMVYAYRSGAAQRAAEILGAWA